MDLVNRLFANFFKIIKQLTEYIIGIVCCHKWLRVQNWRTEQKKNKTASKNLQWSHQYRIHVANRHRLNLRQSRKLLSDWTVISILKLFLLLVDPSGYLVRSRWALNRLLRILNLECYFEIVFLIVEEMQTAQPKMWLFVRWVRRYLNPMTGVFHFTTMRIRFQNKPLLRQLSNQSLASVCVNLLVLFQVQF